MYSTRLAKISIALFTALVFLGLGGNQVDAFGPLAEPGPYFVRALNITVPLRDDLVWGPVLGTYFGRNQIGSMRYNARIYYPAVDTQLENDQYSIYYPPDLSGAPYPAVVFFQGANVSIEQYTWLFEHLTSHGYIVLACTEYMASLNYLEGQFSNLFPLAVLVGASTWLTHMMVPDVITYFENTNISAHDPLPLTNEVGAPPGPGDTLDVVRNNIVEMLCPDETTSCENDDDCMGIGNEQCNPYPTETSIFEGMIDTEKIIIGGHSMGGFLALMCANDNITNPPRPEGGSFTQNVKGVFVYGAHTFRSSGEGFMTPVNVPLLMLGGEKDGVAAGAIPGNPDVTGWERIEYTFDNYVNSSSNNSRYLMGVKAANHLSFGTKPDPMVDRSFIDQKDGIISSFIAHRIFKEKITAFLKYYINGESSVLPILTGSGSEPFIYDYKVK